LRTYRFFSLKNFLAIRLLVIAMLAPKQLGRQTLKPKIQIKLMPDVSPRHYSLVFEPDFKAFKFRGEADIELEVAKPTRKLILNAAELEIKACRLSTKAAEMSASFRINEKKEELVISLPQAARGKCNIHIDFVGTHNDRLIGFYRSKYKDGQGKERWLVTSQFEAADARRAFPCFDEPAAKATFDVTIIADSEMAAISNMPVVEKQKIGGKIAWKFGRTPVMSTYLLYLGVGNFEFVEDKLGKVYIRVAATPGKKEQCKLAMDYTKKFLQFFEKYFGIPYPLPKLDMIAVPDFAAGAMENWGAITFRETALLFDPKTSSTATKQRIAEVIAHELAHQWFGNLVTMEWWNDLWLNESFATFMAFKAVDSLHPEWKMWDQFVLGNVNEALSLDALKTSHPIEVEVEHPSQIREIFDDISYDKGGSVLRMLQNFIGEEHFKAGLKHYLTQNSYGNAKTEDLWHALETACKKPVRKMMGTWIKQVGYPLLDAAVEGSILHLRQKRFLQEPSKLPSPRWLIPLLIEADGKQISRLLGKHSERISLAAAPGWFKVNAGQSGFYRVKYDKPALKKLGKLVEVGKLGNFDRWGLQNDLFALCTSGEASVKEYLGFIEAYNGDEDYLVVSDVVSGLYYLYILFFAEHFASEIRIHGQHLCRPVFDRLGWEPREGEPHTDSLMRSYIIGVLGRLGDEAVLQAANKKFNDFLKEPASLHPDLRGVVYGLAAWQGDAATHGRLTELYRKAPTQEEKNRFLSALCGFRDKKFLLKTLNWALTPDVRTQDLATPIIRVASNPCGKAIIWPWLKSNWAGLCKKFGAGNPLLGHIISSLSVVADLTVEKRMARFFKSHSVPGTEMKIAQMLEKTRIYARLIERARKEFAK
jgi:tricorn protease interacting factor F2/3